MMSKLNGVRFIGALWSMPMLRCVFVLALSTAVLVAQDPAATPLGRIDQDIRDGVYGNVDRLLVTRDGAVMASYRYDRNYRDISRGKTGPLGCGEGCADNARMHEFNYFHPNWHPYYQGRDIHTLQSVTKSIARPSSASPSGAATSSRWTSRSSSTSPIAISRRSTRGCAKPPSRIC
jgi:hypothetical protein